MLPKDFNQIYSKSIKDGWLTTGPEVKKFEKLIADYTKANHVIAVNSCTAALHLALAAKGFGPGDKFIAPTYTFVASVEIGEYLGMEPILIDCDSNYNIEFDEIEKILNQDNQIKAIIPVHFAGKPVDMKKTFSIADKFNLFVLEDAAHALESVSNIGKVGDTNHAAAFSFYANKNITTAGEGGAIATNDSFLADKIRKLSLHGMSKDGWKRFKSNTKWKYDVSELGYKYNMTDIAASFGQWQIKHIKEWYNKRQLIVNAYQNNFNKIQGIVCPNLFNDNEKHAFHLYIIRLKPSRWTISRNKIIELLNEGGIGTSVHYIPVHMHSYYQKKYGFNPSSFPKAREYSENVITLPLYPSLKDDEINYIIEFVTDLWKKYKS